VAHYWFHHQGVNAGSPVGAVRGADRGTEVRPMPSPFPTLEGVMKGLLWVRRLVSGPSGLSSSQSC
jgi:hypothetical protein